MSRGGFFGLSNNQIIVSLTGLLVSLGSFSATSLYAQIKEYTRAAAENVSSLKVEQRDTEIRVTRVEDDLKHVRENLDQLKSDASRQNEKLDRIIQLQMEDVRRSKSRHADE